MRVNDVSNLTFGSTDDVGDTLISRRMMRQAYGYTQSAGDLVAGTFTWTGADENYTMQIEEVWEDAGGNQRIIRSNPVYVIAAV